MKFHGLPISAGVALGAAYLYQPAVLDISREPILPEQQEAELERYASGKAAAAAQLGALHDALAETAADKAAIFRAHIEILQDIAMQEEIEDLITQCNTNAADAVDSVYTQYADLIGAVEDPLMRERAADLMDVRSRLLCCMLHVERASLAEITQPSVIVAQELLPSDTATMDPNMVCAIVTQEGGVTSHSAILARSLGIPAVSGIPDLLSQIENGQLVAVDAPNGTVETDPTAEDLIRYQTLQTQFQQEQALNKTFLPLDPIAKDGSYVQVCLNIGSDTDGALNIAENVDGVGLFRTEFLYMQSASLPDEEAQVRAYTRVAKRFGQKQVILRTLDVGGDKQLPALPLPQEANPFLGLRALRLCLAREELFHIQLRAILRAAVHGNLAVMFPMVGSLDDLHQAKAALERAKASLEADGLAFRRDIAVGVMIEIPSAAIMAQELAREVDFASLGTNDLCQYLLAADRMNPSVAGYYQNYHPAMYRLIAHVQKAFGAAGKPLSVCGEMGGDPAAILCLMGLGIRKFSMNPNAVAAAKRLIRTTQTAAFVQAAQLPFQAATAQELEAGLQALLTSAQ